MRHIPTNNLETHNKKPMKSWKSGIIKRLRYALTEEWREKLSRAAIIKREREKKTFELYKSFVDWEVKKYIKPFIEEIDERNRFIEEGNKQCPKCESKNIVDRMANTKWSVHWDMYWSGYSIFWTGSSYVNWSVDWETVTLPVCHCNNCSNEWIKKTTESTAKNDILESHSFNIYFLILSIEKYLEWKYDDNLVYNKKMRKEKAFQIFLDEIKSYKEALKNFSIETLAYLYYANKIGLYQDDNVYRYRFPQNVIEILQKLWFKYWFEDG